MVVFEEIPDEITLAINITNCPCKCPGCHSKFLWDDNGTELTVEVLHKLIKENDLLDNGNLNHFIKANKDILSFTFRRRSRRTSQLKIP